MRHRKSGLKLGRTSSHRDAMFRNMVTSLFKYEQIRTTDTKAKELRRWAEHLITLAKRGDLHARRNAMSIIREKNVVHKLFEDASERYGSVNGGYTRIVKLERRPGDAALISLIELVIPEPSTKKKGKKKLFKKVKKDTPKSTPTPAATKPEAVKTTKPKPETTEEKTETDLEKVTATEAATDDKETKAD
ncbi:MAG: 50S ribosomal protein L17 [Deltaproteobacteria bacterium]|nr:50S ribosomal protein L17 [Deltaproteobacteria bacterium]